jgi:hypothetical protein
LFGASPPEAIVRTDTTIAGVDYNSSAVWVLKGTRANGDKIRFAVKTVLEEFKNGY